MKCLGQLKVMYIGMFIVKLLKSVSSTPVTSRTGRMKRKSFEGKPEGTRPIVILGWARLSACRGGKSSMEAEGGVLHIVQQVHPFSCHS